MEEIRGEALSFRVTDDEATRIRAAAERMGMTVTDYLRRCVLPPQQNYPIGTGLTLAAGGLRTITWKV